MSKVVSISTLAGEFKNITELQEYCNAQYAALNSSLGRVKELEEEIAHLKTLLEGSTQLVEEKKPELEVSPEQAICEMQIQKLQKAATQRELTLEETKRLDLLIKNLYLAKGQPTAINKNTINPSAYTDMDLIKFAQQPEKTVDD